MAEKPVVPADEIGPTTMGSSFEIPGTWRVTRKGGMLHQAGEIFLPNQVFMPETPISKADFERLVRIGALAEERPGYVGLTPGEISSRLDDIKAGEALENRLGNDLTVVPAIVPTPETAPTPASA